MGNILAKLSFGKKECIAPPYYFIMFEKHSKETNLKCGGRNMEKFILFLETVVSVFIDQFKNHITRGRNPLAQEVCKRAQGKVG
jgi:hypothetical protein